MPSPPSLEAPNLVLIAGPTGSGKTAFAIRLARQCKAEIVGADSVQIYRQMDIGTAKPTPAEQAAVPHHMIDIVDPDQPFDAADYAAMAAGVINDIAARGRTPMVVGGTGFYIKALIHGLFEPGRSDPVLRRRLNREAESMGRAALHRRLQQVDRAAADRIHPNDLYRIVRALEVYELTGDSLTAVQQRHRFRKRRFNTLELGLAWPREFLYDRINRRVDQMISQGFVQEVARLLAAGYGRGLKSMQSLGYRHLAAVLAGEIDLPEAVATLKRDHRRYAKRQLTWFRAQPSMHWLDPDQTAAAGDLIDRFLR
jgi:tRNA dimethylallyltransferase